MTVNELIARLQKIAETHGEEVVFIEAEQTIDNIASTTGNPEYFPEKKGAGVYIQGVGK